MKNKELLKAVLEKGINQGYVVNQVSFDYLMNIVRKDDEMARSAVDYYINEKKYYDTIFSHKFAKAFWGEKKVIEDDSGFNQWHGVSSLGAYSDWQVHLQRMVLEKEPLKYMEKFLDEN